MFALPLALGAFVMGVHSALRYKNSPACVLNIPAGSAAVCVGGLPMAALQLHWRGPLVFLSWERRRGQKQRLVYWPDTLDPETRRELRLAMMQREMSSSARTVAR